METDESRGNEAVTMITYLVTNDKSFKVQSCYIFIVGKKNMMMLNKQEKEKLVLDLRSRERLSAR
jgi:hypothetical protein